MCLNSFTGTQQHSAFGLQVYQVDAGDVQERRRQGTAVAVAGAVHNKPRVQPALPRRSPLPADLGPAGVCALLPDARLSQALQHSNLDIMTGNDSSRNVLDLLFCILQAECVPDPQEIFTHMQVF